jgi:putative addiction module CopG family antidote
MMIYQASRRRLVYQFVNRISSHIALTWEEQEALSMPTTRPLSVTLPIEMIEMVEAKVASGEYATESEVIRDELCALRARDAAVERWLQAEVGEAYDAYKRDPSRAVPAKEVFARLRAHHAAQVKADVADL